ncbi:MAG: hypothetical protein ACI841_003825 [Planctomycetota bacterium]|jgi:hypothetical protein
MNGRGLRQDHAASVHLLGECAFAYRNENGTRDRDHNANGYPARQD